MERAKKEFLRGDVIICSFSSVCNFHILRMGSSSYMFSYSIHVRAFSLFFSTVHEDRSKTLFCPNFCGPLDITCDPLALTVSNFFTTFLLFLSLAPAHTVRQTDRQKTNFLGFSHERGREEPRGLSSSFQDKKVF